MSLRRPARLALVLAGLALFLGVATTATNVVPSSSVDSLDRRATDGEPAQAARVRSARPERRLDRRWRRRWWPEHAHPRHAGQRQPGRCIGGRLHRRWRRERPAERERGTDVCIGGCGERHVPPELRDPDPVDTASRRGEWRRGSLPLHARPERGPQERGDASPCRGRRGALGGREGGRLRPRSRRRRARRARRWRDSALRGNSGRGARAAVDLPGARGSS